MTLEGLPAGIYMVHCPETARREDDFDYNLPKGSHSRASRNGPRNLLTQGLELLTGGGEGTKMAEKGSFGTSSCQISSHNNLKFPPTED